MNELPLTGSSSKRCYSSKIRGSVKLLICGSVLWLLQPSRRQSMGPDTKLENKNKNDNYCIRHAQL